MGQVRGTSSEGRAMTSPYAALLDRIAELEAAGSPRPWRHSSGFLHSSEPDGQSWTIASFRHSNKEEANIASAALPGPALVRAVVWAQRAVDEWLPPASNFDDWEIALIQEGRESLRKVLAECAAVLGVPA